MDKVITIFVMIGIAFFAYTRANRSKKLSQNTMSWIWTALALVAAVIATISLIGLMI